VNALLPVAVAVWTILGYAVVRLVAGPPSRSGIPRTARLGLALGIGIGASALAQFWADGLGVRIALRVQLVAAAALAVVAACVAAVCAWGPRRSPALATEPGADPPEPPRTLDRLLTMAIAVAVALVFAQAVTAPLTQWDPRAIWAFKAKVLHDTGTVRTEHFRDPDRVHPHPRYPLLVPLAQASLWQWTGRVDERPIKLLSPLFLTAWVLVLTGMLRAHTGRTGALLLGALAVWAPMLCIHEWGARSAHADVALAFFHTASALLLLRWLTTGDARSAALAGVAAALGIFTKNEGLALWAIHLVCAAVAVLRTRHRHRMAGWLLFAAIPVWTSIPWLVVRASLPAVSDENYLARLLAGDLATHLDHLPAVAIAVAREMVLRVDRWSVIWIGLALLVVADLRRACRPGPAMLLGAMACYLATVVVLYSVSPWEDVSVHMAVSLPRVLLPILGPAVAVMALLLGGRGDRSTELLPPG